ncbi:unnamed protein product, partial [Amoebophrya sp. A25]
DSHTANPDPSLVFGRNVFALMEEKKSWLGCLADQVLTLPMVISLMGMYYVFMSLILPAMFFMIGIAMAFAVTGACEDYKEQKELLSILGKSNQGTKVKRIVPVASSADAEVEVKDLVPGDVFELPHNYEETNSGQHFTIPCDCVLLSGSCSVNEASLTGEAV